MRQPTSCCVAALSSLSLKDWYTKNNITPKKKKTKKKKKKNLTTVLKLKVKTEKEKGKKKTQ